MPDQSPTQMEEYLHSRKRVLPVVADPSLSAYELSSPVSVQLFGRYEDVERDGTYSRLFDFWSLLPLFTYGKQKRFSVPDTALEVLPVATRFFQYRHRDFRLEIHPARIRIKLYRKGKAPRIVDREFYPGLREELVQDALIKLAVHQGCFLGRPGSPAGVSVVFTLYALCKELRTSGHCYTPAEVRQAMEICRRTALVFKAANGKVLMETSIFSAIGFNANGKPQRCFVIFNPLITAAVSQGEWRLVSYRTSMRFKHCMARRLYKRLVLRYVQASPDSVYGFWLSNLLKESGTATYRRFRCQVRDFELALDELVANHIVLPSWREEKFTAHDPRNPRKIADIKYHLRATSTFQKEMIRSNFLRSRVAKALGNMSSRAALKAQTFKSF